MFPQDARSLVDSWWGQQLELDAGTPGGEAFLKRPMTNPPRSPQKDAKGNLIYTKGILSKTAETFRWGVKP